MDRIVVLGGYGTAGMAIARLLVREAPVDLVLAGRDERKAQTAAEYLSPLFIGGRVSGLRLDASDRAPLTKAMEGARIVVVASSTIDHCPVVAESALDAGVDYFDLQLSSRRKLDYLKQLASRIESAGRCFITDGGCHPGLPAALIRYARLSFDQLDSAITTSVIRMAWGRYQFSAASVAEFTEELKEFRPAFFKDGHWRESWTESLVCDFGAPFGKLRCAPMGLEELAALPGLIPTLREIGFYLNAFDAFTSNAVLPLGVGVVTYLPALSRLFQQMFVWSATTFAKPPFGMVMVTKATGVQNGRKKQLQIRLAHEDPYVFTAAPVVACLNQYQRGSIRRPGLHWQGNLVEPSAFFQDLTRMGLLLDVQ